MSRNDIIRMAREAGMPPVEIISDKPVLYPVPDAIERFFHLAAAAGADAEREAMLDLVDDYAKGNTDLKDAIRARGEK